MNKFLPLLAGIIFIAGGIFIYIHSEHLKKVCTTSTQATIVDFKQEIDDESNNVSYFPIIEYEVNGKKYNKTHSTSDSMHKYSVGQKINILYNPDNPDEYYIEGDGSDNIVSFICFGVGGIVSFLGIYMLIKKQHLS